MIIELNWIMCVWPLSVLGAMLLAFRFGVWATKRYLIKELATDPDLKGIDTDQYLKGIKF